MVCFLWHLPPAELDSCDDILRICRWHHAQLSLCGAPCRRTHQKYPEGRPKGSQKPSGRGLRAHPRAQRGQGPPRGATTIGILFYTKNLIADTLSPPKRYQGVGQEVQVRSIPRTKIIHLSVPIMPQGGARRLQWRAPRAPENPGKTQDDEPVELE